LIDFDLIEVFECLQIIALSAARSVHPRCPPMRCAIRVPRGCWAVTGDIKLVQEWIGHRDTTTTARVYAKVLNGQKINGVTVLEA